MKRALRSLVVVVVALAAWPMAAADEPEKVLIRGTKPYASIKSTVAALGGRVVHEFKYVDAVAAEVPRASLSALRAIVGDAGVSRDYEIAAPKPIDLTARPGRPEIVAEALDIHADAAEALDVSTLSQSGVEPAAYLVNNGIANVSGLHSAGFTGLGVTVAVIDSGLRPGFPHLTLDGSVVGCEDFVLDALGCSNAGNNGHGTFVAGMISANVTFTFAATSALRIAVLAECPACFANPPVNTQIPMFGTAPRASIYALRVLPPTGGTPTSRLIAAIERVIELRELYDAGNPAGRNITVCNMSLGGATVAAGRDLLDRATDVLLDRGIVPVIAAANAGPSSLTTGSPGSAANAITVGAASLPHNERILRRAQFGPVLGDLYRPFLGVQTAYFSSRGPNADGRPDPDVVSNGFGNYGQGLGATSNSISLGSGTSFASPSVAGIAAVLRQRFPTAPARQIRNAIIASADPSVLNDGSTAVDRGRGYVNAGAAVAMIEAGTVPDLPGLSNYNPSVKVNIERNTTLNVRDGSVTETATGLKPGQRFDLLYRVQPNTRQVVIVLSNVMPLLPPEEQNQLFGDDILLTVHSAKTSSIGEGDYRVFTFTLGNTFVVNDPEEGIMRITVNGDWTNAGPIDATISAFSIFDPVPVFTTAGSIGNGDVVAIPIVVPAGTSAADFRLAWRENWGQYPTSDIDMYLVRPNGTIDFSGASLNSPERVVVNAPAPGNWLIVIEGFEVAARGDKYELRVALDGKVVKK